jgi:hypothetical protein
MLVACQLAGLSALGAHYAGVKWRATRDKRLRPSFRGSAARDREGGLKGRGGHAAGLGGSRAGCAARPLRWCKKEGNGRLRRVGMGFLRSERALMPRGQCTIPHFEHFAVAQRRDKGGTRPAPAISRQKPDNTRHSWEDALHDRRPKPPFRKGPPSLGRGQRGSRILRPRPDLGRGVDASPSFKQQLPLRADLPSRPSPQCPACHPARAAEVSAPRAFKPEVERRQWDDHGSIPAADSARHS